MLLGIFVGAGQKQRVSETASQLSLYWTCMSACICVCRANSSVDVTECSVSVKVSMCVRLHTITSLGRDLKRPGMRAMADWCDGHINRKQHAFTSPI